MAFIRVSLRVAVGRAIAGHSSRRVDASTPDAEGVPEHLYVKKVRQKTKRLVLQPAKDSCNLDIISLLCRAHKYPASMYLRGIARDNLAKGV